MNSWMLYGAYGYTGNLIAHEAKLRGHSPVLAGRSANRLIPLAEELKLAGNIAAAKVWADHAAEQRILEEEDRIANAEFWLAYQEKKRIIAELNRPSNLNFGLL